MAVTTTGHLSYCSSAAASEPLSRWKRVLVEFELDESRKPRAVRLTPAPAGSSGFKVRFSNSQRPRVDIPTSAVGWARPARRRDVEETISESEIIVSIPFEFRVAGAS